MTGEIINLRRARKQKARSAAEREAAQNRLTFGRTKSERESTGAERERAEQHLSGHRRQSGPDETLP